MEEVVSELAETVPRDGRRRGLDVVLQFVDLPVDQVSNVTVTVEQDANVVATGLEAADTEWTFLVAP